MKYSIVVLLLLFFVGCTVTSRLERRKSRAVAEYVPAAKREEKRRESKSYIEVKHDSTHLYFAPAVTDENGEQMMSLTIDEVVVVAKSRTLPERKGHVTIDFVVTLPKELQGGCRSVRVTPWLHKTGEEVPLQELSIRGGLFSRVQDRNYWQFDRYVRVFRPDAAQKEKAFERFVKYPYPEDVRLDSVADNRETISYYYTQDVPTEGEGRKMLITLRGEVVALDGSRYALPPLDTLQFNISSMISFIDTTTRYVDRIIEKYAVVNDRNYLSFKVNDTRIIDTLDDNRVQLDRIEGLMERLINQDEFYVDSIVLTASSSPEGLYERNEGLAKQRALSLKRYLAERFGSDTDTLINVRWIAEDWEELSRLITGDEILTEKGAILDIIDKVREPDKRETALRTKFPKEYKYIRESLYPLLRSVSFRYDLRRVGMIKDTVHTTEPDTLYARGVRLLSQRRYADALRILDDYKDLNCAIALLSLGYDGTAREVLAALPETAEGCYLTALACARLGKDEEGREYFLRACTLNGAFEYRGSLDPEITKLLTVEKQ